MATKHVQDRWTLYRLLMKINCASISDKILINHPNSPVPDFPTKTSEWPGWAMGVDVFLTLDELADLADAALTNAVGGLARAHDVATAVKVNAPSDDAIKEFTASLEKLNEVIKQDQRFHAALAIGVAVAGEVERRRALP